MDQGTHKAVKLENADGSWFDMTIKTEVEDIDQIEPKDSWNEYVQLICSTGHSNEDDNLCEIKQEPCFMLHEKQEVTETNTKYELQISNNVGYHSYDSIGLKTESELEDDNVVAQNVQSMPLDQNTEMKSKKLKCSTCGKGFDKKNKLAEHERIHSGEKPFVCSICGKGFARTSACKNHERTHLVNRPYSCSICGKGFSRKAHLEEHQPIHSFEKPYTCKVCYKSFARSYECTIHERSHSGEKQYACSVCDKRFLRGHDRNVHEKTHSENRPYSCSICFKRFK